MNKSTTTRNLIIFAVVTLSAGWIGAWVNTIIPSPSPQESLGILIFLLLPFLTVFLLRGLGGDGWKDFGLRLNLKDNLGWYIFALLVHPVSIIFVLLLGAVFGVTSFEGLFDKGFGALFSFIAFGFVASLLKNIAEEFAWRGYLTPRFNTLGLGNFTNHILTGVIWGLWHVPYWLFLIGPEIINEYSELGITGFIIMGLIGIFPSALIYGELRLKTDSLWPAFLAHNLVNAIIPQLLLSGFVSVATKAQLVFSPGLDGLLMIVFTLGVGLWMLKKNR